MNPTLLYAISNGSRARVILAFVIARTCLDVSELVTMTGMKRETVYQACEGLAQAGLLGKQTLAHGRELWIPAGAMLPLAPFQMSEKRTPELPATTTIDSINSSNINTVVVVEGQMSPKRTSGEDVLYESLDASFDKNVDACRRKGIGEPKRTTISLLPHVTPRLIIDHVDSLVPGETIGLAIRRIEADEVPRKWLEEIEGIERPQEEPDEQE